MLRSVVFVGFRFIFTIIAPHFVIPALFLAVPESLASETDNFTLRSEDWVDASPWVDIEVNTRLRAAANEVNKNNHSSDSLMNCDSEALFSALKDRLNRYLFGEIEGWVLNGSPVPQKRVPLEKSIYKEVGFFSNWPMHLGVMGFGSVLSVNGNLFGTDKLGHFFDQGYEYYERLINDGAALEGVLKEGEKTEDQFYGLWHTGVKSFADLNANFQGLRFWLRVIDQKIENENVRKLLPEFYIPYFTCFQEKWIPAAEFHLRDYVSASWDEAINCSQFASPKFEADVLKVIRQLEVKQGRHLQCPAEPEKCEQLTHETGVWAPFLLHTRCRTQ